MNIITIDDLVVTFEKRCCELHGDLVITKQFMKKMYPDTLDKKWKYFLCLRSAIMSDGTITDIKRVHLRHLHHLHQGYIRKLQRKAQLEEIRQGN